MKITVPMVPPSGNVLRRKYRTPLAYASLRNAWERTIMAFLPAGSRPQQNRRMRVMVTIEHKRLYDRDNAFSGCKPVFDSLKRLGLIVDDSEQWCEQHVEQIQSRENQTTIEVTEVAA